MDGEISYSDQNGCPNQAVYICCKVGYYNTPLEEQFLALQQPFCLFVCLFGYNQEPGWLVRHLVTSRLHQVVYIRRHYSLLILVCFCLFRVFYGSQTMLVSANHLLTEDVPFECLHIPIQIIFCHQIITKTFHFYFAVFCFIAGITNNLSPDECFKCLPSNTSTSFISI